MKDVYTIRPAKNHDARKVFNFLCEMEEHLFDQQEFELNYRSCLSDINNIYLVADLNKEAVGFISCHGQILLHHGGMVYEIQELFVHSAHRGKGVGKLLLKSLEDHLAKRDYKKHEVSAQKNTLCR